MVLGVDVISCSSRCLPPGPDSLGLPEALQSHHTVFGSAAQKSTLPRTAPYPQDKPPPRAIPACRGPQGGRD